MTVIMSYGITYTWEASSGRDSGQYGLIRRIQAIESESVEGHYLVPSSTALIVSREGDKASTGTLEFDSLREHTEHAVGIGLLIFLAHSKQLHGKRR